MSWPWSQLGLPGPSGLSEIRHAYAEKLKTTHPEEDPEGFQRLHSAYQLASRMARQQKRQGGTLSPEPEAEVLAPPPQPLEERENCDRDQRLQEGEQDFDFERLFAEGEAERAEARRRRGEERRQRRGQEEELDTFLRQERDRWRDTETILHTITLLYNAEAWEGEWRAFFQSPLFQQNKDSLDLIFGLEDFVSTRNLSQEVRLELFLAYAFDQGPGRPELRPLFQMLLPAWTAYQMEKQRMNRHGRKDLFVCIAVVVCFLAVMDASLGPGASLGALLLAGVFGVGMLIGWIKLQFKERNRRKLALGIVVLGLLLIAFGLSVGGGELPGLRLPSKDPREQTCRYIEQDFGVKVKSLYNESDYYANDIYGNVFYLEEHPNRQFLAGPDGGRDIENGKPGYTTNLPEILLLWSLKDFMYQRNIYDVDALDRDQELERWETSGIFLITLPEENGEEIVEDLGVLLEELSQTAWYQVLSPQCEVVLCSGQMMEGRVILTRWRPADGTFDTKAVRDLYETAFTYTYCAQLIKELGLDWDFIREEGEHYTLTNEGAARLKGRDCYRLCGLDGSGETAMEYYVCLEERNLYCVPGNFWDTGNTEEQIGFYRLLHWGDGLGTVNLFYPWLWTENGD